MHFLQDDRNPRTSGAAIGERELKRRVTDAVRIAAIDVGSNSVRQIVADVLPDGAITVVDEMKAAPRLGTGLEATGRLDDAAMTRAVDALKQHGDARKKLDADRVVAVATSAVRDAANATEFVARVKSRTGLALRILTGDDEARLSYRSALAHFESGSRGRRSWISAAGPSSWP